MEEKELNLHEEGRVIWLRESIEEDLRRVYDHYRSVVSRKEYLEEENKKLKSGAYKDEELAKMKAEYEAMKADWCRGFAISEEEDKKIKEWEDKIIGEGPDMKINGARFHYEFYPTPLGTVGKVVDNLTGEKLTFQEIS